MTVTTVEIGNYCTAPYCVEGYCTPAAIAAMGMQFEAYFSVAGAQFEGLIDGVKPFGLQFNAEVSTSSPAGMQFEGVISGTSARGAQFKGLLPGDLATGMQFQGMVAGQSASGMQFEGFIDSSAASGMQFEGVISDSAPAGIQFQGVIPGAYSTGMQFEGFIDGETARGMQFQSTIVQGLGCQFRAVLYNRDNLRILCQFPSRGVAGGNWSASSTAVGDFDIDNVNSDIVELVWRSVTGVVTGVNLDCDTGLSQGVFLDTFAILNHNLSSSAVVELKGADDPSFAVPGFQFTLTVEDENLYYISPDLPIDGYRYWRISIDDATNPDNFLQVGTIVFGAATILHRECFSNPINYKKRHFTDQVFTEGFTNVENVRGLKRQLLLDFRAMDFNGGNFENFQEIFQTARTNLKCLWIPTPQYPSRYATFGKLVELPREEHIDNGEQADYVSFQLEIDEAK